MKSTLSVQASVIINASPARVWNALTSPQMIKKYLMGTNVVTDWKEGSSITYSGEYNGKQYYDKGVITKVVQEKILQSTYLSSMSGKEDKPGNYYLITYKLEQEGGKIILTLTQDNIPTETEKEHTLKNWTMVLNTLKDLVESENK
jgi:uncharacterized protein YndB with AHSA1/START domain